MHENKREITHKRTGAGVSPRAEKNRQRNTHTERPAQERLISKSRAHVPSSLSSSAGRAPAVSRPSSSSWSSRRVPSTPSTPPNNTQPSGFPVRSASQQRAQIPLGRPGRTPLRPADASMRATSHRRSPEGIQRRQQTKENRRAVSCAGRQARDAVAFGLSMKSVANSTEGANRFSSSARRSLKCVPPKVTLSVALEAVVDIRGTAHSSPHCASCVCFAAVAPTDKNEDKEVVKFVFPISPKFKGSTSTKNDDPPHHSTESFRAALDDKLNRRTETNQTILEERPNRRKGSIAPTSLSSEDELIPLDSGLKKQSVVNARGKSKSQRNTEATAAPSHARSPTTTSSATTASLNDQNEVVAANSHRRKKVASCNSRETNNLNTHNKMPRLLRNAAGGKGDQSQQPAATPAPSGKFRREEFIFAFKGPLTDHYILEQEKLGEGTYGSVCKGVNKATNCVRAIKSITKTKVKNAERFRQEIAIMKGLDHPNIIKLYETYEDHTCIYLVLELCTGGELFDHVIDQGFFSEEVAARYMRQIFAAVFYLHNNQKVVHRDLKPENFLFLDKSPDSPLKIIDFGLAARCKNDQVVLTTKAGTPYYVAPQVLMGSYTSKCDAWSAGVIMYILLCGYPPFHGDSDAEILQRVKSAKVQFNDDDWRGVSMEARDLIVNLLQADPEMRFSAEQALNHRWIRQRCSGPASCLSSRIVDNFKSFRALSKLKKAAITLIAKSLSEQEIHELKNAFLALDTDGDGSLSLQEILEAINRSSLQQRPNDLEILLQEVDSDGSGLIDYTEFIAAALDRHCYIQEDVCWQAFRLFDLDGNGKISSEELLQVFHANREELEKFAAEEEVKRLILEIDKDGDGEVDFGEFLAMMRQVEKVGTA